MKPQFQVEQSSGFSTTLIQNDFRVVMAESDYLLSFSCSSMLFTNLSSEQKFLFMLGRSSVNVAAFCTLCANINVFLSENKQSSLKF